MAPYCFLLFFLKAGRLLHIHEFLKILSHGILLTLFQKPGPHHCSFSSKYCAKKSLYVKTLKNKCYL